MGVRLITKPVQKELGQIIDADVEFVSLVRHGANRQGFRVVKSEKGGPDGMPVVVQSIMVPKGIDLDALASSEGNSWLNDVKKEEKVARGDYTEFVQLPKEKFDESSLALQKLGDSGALVSYGILREGVKEDALTLPKTETVKTKQEPLAFSFKDIFLNELSGFVHAVTGALAKADVSPSDRKKLVLGSHKALGDVLSMGLDKMTEAKKSDFSEELKELGEAVTDIISKMNGEPGGEDMALFKTDEEKKEMATFIAGVVKEVLKADKKRPPFPPDEDEESDMDEGNEKKEMKTKEKSDSSSSDGLNTKVDQLTATVTTLAAKMDKLGNGIVTQPKAKSDEEIAAEEAVKQQKQKWESFPSGVPKDQRAGVFSGLLVDWDRYNATMEQS